MQDRWYTSLISSSLLSKCSLLVKYWKLLSHVISTTSFKKGTKGGKNMNAGQGHLLCNPRKAKNL